MIQQLGLDIAALAGASIAVVAGCVGLCMCTYGAVKYLNTLDTTEARGKHGARHYARIKRDPAAGVRQRTCLPPASHFNAHEQALLGRLVNPAESTVTLDDIYGMDDLKRALVQEFTAVDSELQDLMPMSKGILLYGPPGTGKTTLAKAFAREAGFWFLDVTASSIQSRWYGEANRAVAAVFSLARKLQPCVVFIDEVDALLDLRHATGESEASRQVKSEFLKLWDGMESDPHGRVLVMGATNRPRALDEAAWRRFTCRLEVPLPDAEGRRAILRGYVHKLAAALQRSNPQPVDGELLRMLQPPRPRGGAAADSGQTKDGAGPAASAAQPAVPSRPEPIFEVPANGASVAAPAAGACNGTMNGHGPFATAISSADPQLLQPLLMQILEAVADGGAAPRAGQGGAGACQSADEAPLVAATSGFSGSDLQVLCSAAVKRAYFETRGALPPAEQHLTTSRMRLTARHLEAALEDMLAQRRMRPESRE
ncbi:hypothetical protein GPECTOR_10g869 [Gonium pectorale]|uniref:AAA+ ATPase domain-containing protein n=1 Tax=Gonium pectorale TaxID=33097 RepID=A0A150GR72_GONPE|nr:hypothetical protein GPECTOR_10g869 [Gonium pectorale]|eukprot:KXZ52238.1 hypothetical protein GPECTOR_10g869 [Gonium pectorale]